MGNDQTIDDALKEIAKLYKWIYFQSMVSEKNQTVENFKNSQHRFLDGVVDKIHNKYEDHIEGMRKQLEVSNTL